MLRTQRGHPGKQAWAVGSDHLAHRPGENQVVAASSGTLQYRAAEEEPEVSSGDENSVDVDASSEECSVDSWNSLDVETDVEVGQQSDAHEESRGEATPPPQPEEEQADDAGRARPELFSMGYDPVATQAEEHVEEGRLKHPISLSLSTCIQRRLSSAV